MAPTFYPLSKGSPFTVFGQLSLFSPYPLGNITQYVPLWFLSLFLFFIIIYAVLYEICTHGNSLGPNALLSVTSTCKLTLWFTASDSLCSKFFGTDTYLPYLVIYMFPRTVICYHAASAALCIAASTYWGISLWRIWLPPVTLLPWRQTSRQNPSLTVCKNNVWSRRTLYIP